ncbi:FecCD family ABC transporter permease [Nesterenkonia lutea]|uniref:Iron complex transport system permease protein n=1 Tax=Nesterenkonia lutea TaxID=272919 RepID=A0ABR9JFU6_9MICC|nr:iron chelate uptake ABC transporter family permease subunit [Nesterenkonia lutea]MBE1524808.1 iron complex transport system permease protein [Nesterenkonia lutea]
MTAESHTLRRPGRPGMHPHALGRSATPRTRFALILGLFLLLLLCLASISIGSRGIGLDTIWAALSAGEVSAADEHAVLGLRVPRTLAAVVVGAALAVAGALMQSLTRNPLAEPGLLGVSAGSAFAVAIAIVGFGITAPLGYIWFALAGAFGATVTVALIGGMSSGRADPMRLVLAGVALSAVLSGIIGALRLSDPRTFNALQVWEAGILAGRGLDVTLTVAPLVLAALLVALPLGKGLNTLALGDELAAALGVSLWKTRVLSILAITVLAGGAAAIAGPIAFIGLMVPHAARFFAGADQRWVLLLSMVFGPILMLTADILARLIVWPGEMPVGLVSALIGAPVLVLLIRRRKALKL